MKTTITIVIETHEENPPTLEVQRVIQDSQVSLDLEEKIQTSLDAFVPIRTGTSRIGAPTYAQGRATHHCSACGAPNRRKDPVTGLCKEEACV